MKYSRKILSLIPLTFVIFSLLPLAVFGAIYDGQEMELTQPDGSVIIVRGFGDEFYGRFESLDGYTLVRDSNTGEMVYAVLSDDGSEFVPSDVVYDHRKPTDPNHPSFYALIGAMQRAADKSNGKVKGRGILGKHIDLDKKVIARKQKERRMELGLDVYGLPIEEDGTEDFYAPAPEAAPSDYEEIVGLTILVDFSDDPNTIAPSAVDDFCNKVGYNVNGNNGSVRDYFYYMSGGQLEYTNIVTAYVRVPHTKAYYREGGNGDCTDGYGYTRQLVKDAISGAIDLGYDFSTLTREGTNNRVKCLNIMYAGGTDSCGWAKGLWPHRSSISNWTAPDGTIFHDYQMTNIGTSLIIGTFCHENGHMMMGWADYYDYGNDGVSAKGLGSYCIMSGGNRKNPPPPNPYLRITSGWLTPTVINDLTVGTVLTAQEDPFDLSVEPTCYKYDNPANDKEYFLVENCQKNGRRVKIPDTGLMIWHVDASPGTKSEYQDMTPEKHYRVSLEQADGLFHLETPGSTGSGADDLFHAGNNDRFTDNTLPDAKWWDGSDSGLYISKISGNSVNMTFTVGNSSIPLTDMISWSGEPVELNPNFGGPSSTYQWSAAPSSGVVFSNPNIQAPTVTITKVTNNPSVVTLTLVVDDLYEGTMDIDVYDDSCKATRIGKSMAAEYPADISGNCIVGIEDFAILASTWLNDNALIAPQRK